MPEECATSADSSSRPNNSCSDVNHSNSHVSPAGFGVDRESAGSSRSSTAWPDSTSRQTNSRDPYEGRRSTADLQPKPSLDMSQPDSTTASDSSKISRFVNCVV